MPPTPYSPQDGQIYVSVPLTNFSIAYLQRPSAFVAGRVMPSLPVVKQADRYVVYPKGAFFRSQMARRAKGTRAAVASYDVDNSPTYFCETWALAKPIADEDRVNQTAPINLDRDATIWLLQQGLLAREVEFANTFFKPGVWSYNKSGVASAPNAQQFVRWSDYTNSDPIANVRTWRREMLQETGMEPQVLTLARGVYDVLADHPDIVDRIKYGQTAPGAAVVNRQTMAAVFEVDEINVCNAVQNTAVEGATDAFSFIMANGALLTYRAPGEPSLMQPQAGMTFAWTGFLPGQGATLGEVISRFRDGPARTDYIQADLAYDMKIVAPDCGLFAASVIS